MFATVNVSPEEGPSGGVMSCHHIPIGVSATPFVSDGKDEAVAEFSVFILNTQFNLIKFASQICNI